MDRTTGILQQLVNGELTEKEVAKKPHKPLSQVRQMRTDALKSGAITASRAADAPDVAREVGK